MISSACRMAFFVGFLAGTINSGPHLRRQRLVSKQFVCAFWQPAAYFASASPKFQSPLIHFRNVVSSERECLCEKAWTAALAQLNPNFFDSLFSIAS